MEYLIIISLVYCGVLAYGIWRFTTFGIENIKYLEELTARQEAERKDLIDRLMARDLIEVKQAQNIERKTGGRVLSKGQNERKIAEEKERLGK